MAESSHKTGGMPIGGGIAVVITLIAGYFVVSPPNLSEKRPDAPVNHIKQIHDSSEDVEARLWQDPFAAVAEEQKSRQSENKFEIQVIQIKGSDSSDFVVRKDKPVLSTNTDGQTQAHSFSSLENDVADRWVEHFIAIDKKNKIELSKYLFKLIGKAFRTINKAEKSQDRVILAEQQLQRAKNKKEAATSALEIAIKTRMGVNKARTKVNEARAEVNKVGAERDKAKEESNKAWENARKETEQVRKSWAGFKSELPEYSKEMVDAIVKDANKDANENLKDRIRASRITVLMAMVPGGPYAEESESRMRRRYAIVSSLANSDFQPVDAKHIGYIKVDNSKNGTEYHPKLPEIIPYEWYKDIHGKRAPVLLLWLDNDAFGNIPIRKLEYLINRFSEESDPDQLVSDIKIIGPSSSATFKSMLKGLTGGKWQLGKGPLKTDYTVSLFSPTMTAPAEDLLDKKYDSSSEISSNDDSGPGVNTRSHAPDKALEMAIVRFFHGGNIEFRRETPTDEDLTNLLVQELETRGVNLQDKKDKDVSNVALISEWDTFYGRELPKAFERSLCSHLKDDDHENCIQRIKQSVFQYSYMRGIDGKLPGDEKSARETADPNKAKAGDLSQKASVELASGKSQVDYLRRLANQLSDTDAKLKKQGGKGIEAIGILGSDVFDKLLILRALRERFPDAIFFTTDLDANYMHPDNFKWTRNMIVASTFGLQPKWDSGSNIKLASGPGIKIPPFRSSYQTAIYCSTLKALGRETPCQIAPQLFEVGRDGAFNLTRFEEERRANHMNTKLLRHAYWAGLAIMLLIFAIWHNWWRLTIIRYRNTEPEGKFFDILKSPLTWALVAAACLALTGKAMGPGWLLGWFPVYLAGLYWLTKYTYPYSRKLFDILKSPLTWAFIIAACLALIGKMLGPIGLLVGFLVYLLSLYGLTYYAYTKSDKYCIRQANEEKPCNFESGDQCAEKELTHSSCPYSPPAILQKGKFIAILIAAGFSVALAVEIYSSPEPFSLRDGISIWPAEILRWIAILLCVYLFFRAWTLIRRNHQQISADLKHAEPEDIPASEPPNSILQIWRTYSIDGKIWKRFRRIFLLWLPYFAMCIAVITYEPTFVPYRGPGVARVDTSIIAVAVLFYTLMIFAISDATMLCRNFIGRLIRIDTIWPFMNEKELADKDTLTALLKNNSQDPPDVAYRVKTICRREWEEIKLIAKRTAVISKLVYYPIVIALILIASRSRYFDNWTTSLGLAFVMALNIVIVLGCTILLRRKAVAAKAASLERLDAEKEWLLDNGYAPSGDMVKHIAHFEERVTAIKTGAFLPIPEQPWVQAISLLFGGGGAILLFDILSLAR